MKLLNLATIGLLSTSILAGGVTAFAEEVRNATTDGEISFTAIDEDGAGDDTVVIPPEGDEGPEVEIPPIVGSDGVANTGPLTIAYAPTINFGSQVISNQDRDYSMVAEMQQLAGTTGDENKVPYTSFAQVQDTRGTNAGWDLQVSLSDFVSGTQNGTLTGAEISLHDPRIQYEGSNVENTPAGHTSGLTLRPGAGAVSVMNADTTKGAGVSSVVWGDQAALDAQFEDEDVNVVRNDSVVLSIPGSTAKDAATYESTLTWELTATPGEDA